MSELGSGNISGSKPSRQERSVWDSLISVQHIGAEEAHYPGEPTREDQEAERHARLISIIDNAPEEIKNGLTSQEILEKMTPEEQESLLTSQVEPTDKEDAEEEPTREDQEAERHARLISIIDNAPEEIKNGLTSQEILEKMTPEEQESLLASWSLTNIRGRAEKEGLPPEAINFITAPNVVGPSPYNREQAMAYREWWETQDEDTRKKVIDFMELAEKNPDSSLATKWGNSFRAWLHYNHKEAFSN